MSFWRNYYHLVWATHRRSALITPSIEAALYTYLIDTSADFEVYIYAIGSTEDHIHIIAAIPPALSVSQLVTALKEGSAGYINQIKRPIHLELTWEPGYGCLTFGESQLPTAIDYVKAQRLHHADNTTNTWLERMDITNEGPADPGLSEKIAALLRERRADYQIELGDPPF